MQALEAPRVVWVMVPAGEPTRATVRELGELLSPGDVIVDGGNSKFTDDQVHAEELGAKGIGYVDAGVSGGVWGLQNGYALMVGGTQGRRRQGPADLRRAQATVARPRTAPRRTRAPASCTPGRSVPGTSPRWSTTASSTR